jgi:hypothetical protein
MTKWNDQLNQHALSITLSDLSERLKDEELISDDINVIELINKINQLVVYCELALRNVIPELVSAATLNGANSHMTNVRNELNSYISNKNIAHLNNAVSHVDSTMAQLISLPIPRSHIEEETYSESLSKFKLLITKSFQELKEAKDQLDRAISDVSEKSESQSESISTLAENIQQHKNNIETQLTQFNERFESFETAANTMLDTSIEESGGKISYALTSYKAAFDEHLEAQKNSGSNVIESLEQNKQQASDLVQIIGNIGITGNYQKIANQEKAAADKWRNIALVLMICMVLVIAVTIGISAADGFNWKLALFRIGAALALAIPATYAAKESSKHRVLENINRKAELELASLDPFLEKLPENIRFKIKEELTGKFFGSSVTESKEEKSTTYSELKDLLKVAISKK